MFKRYASCLRPRQFIKVRSLFAIQQWGSIHAKTFNFTEHIQRKNPRRLIYIQKPGNPLNYRDRNPNSNRKLERVARLVNKRVMSGEQGSSTFHDNSGSNDEYDDISLTFWIFLWTGLAIVASWIYTKLNREPVAVEADHVSESRTADEQIARKLVNEISKNDLVKRSTFRRQRSYEIIDGEVHIHYDVSFDESSYDKTNHGKNIIDSAEIDTFPARRNSMEEMELFFPGNLPRIIEEGEEEEEIEEIVHAIAVSSEETCQAADGKRETNPAVNVADRSSGKDSMLATKQSGLMKESGSSEKNQTGESNPMEKLGEFKQTKASEIPTFETQKNSVCYVSTQLSSSLLSNSDKSSSDENSSTSEDSISENVGNAQIFHSDNQTMVAHSSNSPTGTVYRLTEVQPTEGHSYTVTRRKFTKPNNKDDKCLQTKLLPSRTRSELEKPVECERKEKQLDALDNNCQNILVVENDKFSLHGRRTTDVQRSFDDNNALVSPSCQPNEQQDSKLVNETDKEELVAVAFDVKRAHAKEKNVHNPEMVSSKLTNRKLVNTPLDHSDSLDESCGNICSKSELDHSEVQCEEHCEVPEKSSLGVTDQKLAGSVEEGQLEFCCLEGDNDLLIDTSGDVLFKVIGPSEDYLLEDIEEDVEYSASGNHDDHFIIDENENYCSFETDVELSKNWRSLPSWEKAHHIHHRELDRDANDSDVECSDSEVSDTSDSRKIEMIKSEEIIRSNIQPATEGHSVECAVMTAMLGNDRHSGLKKDLVEPVSVSCDQDTAVSKVLVPARNSDAYHQLDTQCNTTQEPSKCINAGGMMENFEDQEEIGFNAKQLDNKSTTIISEHNNAMEEDAEVNEFGQAAIMQDYPEATEDVQGIITNNLINPESGDNTRTQNECTDEVLLHLSETNHDEISFADTGTGTGEIREGNDLPHEEFIGTFSTERLPEEHFPGNMVDTRVRKNDCSDKEVVVTYLSGNEDKNTCENMSDWRENESQLSDEEIIVAYSSESNKDPGVIYASEITDVTKHDRTPSDTQPYSIVNVTDVSTYKYEDDRAKFEETYLENVPSTSSPVTGAYFEKEAGSKRPYHEGTDIDEIDIDNIEPQGNYSKSKSVTDLDEALASYGNLEYPMSSGVQSFDDETYNNSISKSVPDILDRCLKEGTVTTTNNTSDECLPDHFQKKNLSVSSPDITDLKSKEKMKKITKIKIVHVKFLEMEDGSGSENIEEESFRVEGEKPMSGKMKRRSGHFSPDYSPTTTEKQGEMNQPFTVMKTQEEQLQFGPDDLFKDFSTPASSRHNVEGKPTSMTTSDSVSNHSTEMIPERETHVARFGVIQSQAAKTKYSEHHGLKLSEKFQMPQNTTSQHKEKPLSSAAFQRQVQPTQTVPDTNRQPNREAVPYSYQLREKQLKNQSVGNKISHSRPTSAHHSGRLVTVKSGVINDYYECSSDADSETSYNTPPRMKARKSHRTVVRQDTTDSASSSEPDSPRARAEPNNDGTRMTQIFGVHDDDLNYSKPTNLWKEKKVSRNLAQEGRLFSRFGHFQQSGQQVGTDFFNREQELEALMKRNMSQETQFEDVSSYTSNRSIEFNPFTGVEGCDGFEPSERSHSPTSIASDQSSVFSFNCDFDPMPPPTTGFNPEVYTCDNPMCRKQDILLGPEKTSYKSCPACFTYYCSSECRKLHWPAHKQSCYFGRVNTYVRSIIRLCQRRQDLSMYLSQLARDGYNKKGRGVVMATFNSPELAREFITKGHDAFSGKKPTYSSLAELNREGVISKHRVALMQAVRDYEPNEEFVFNIAVVAVNDIPITPAPRYKLNTVLHCIKMPLNEKIVARQPKEYDKVETRLFALPKCARHEFVNEMEARRHYCRNLSKNLRLYNIKLKEDYQECYKKLCMYVEHDISFEPMTVYGQRNGLRYKCIIAPEQNYALNQEYC